MVICVSLLLVCVRVPFSFPIFMMFVLWIFKISLYMLINTLLYHILIFYFPRLSFFFQFCSWWFLNFFLLLLYGNVKFKLCNKMYPSFASEIWKSCILLCASKGFPSHKIIKFLLTFSSRHFMVLFFAILTHMKISITALSLMISTSRSSVNTFCYSVSCSVCSEIVIHSV